MILPTKYISTNQSLISSGVVLLNSMDEPLSPKDIWEMVNHRPEIKSYNRFVLILVFLYSIEAIDFDNGLIVKRSAP